MVDIEKRGEGGFDCYRIPSIVCNAAGRIVTAYECRITPNDWDTRAVGFRYSDDGGLTWSNRAIHGSHDSLAVNNPVLCALRDGSLIFIYQFNYERTFVRRSEDGGQTFSDAKEITAAFDGFRAVYNFYVCATGPGHGIELDGGRIVIPVWLANDSGRRHSPSVTASVISDDGGLTWRAGEIIPSSDTLTDPNETSAAQLQDGRIMFNIRHSGGTRRRAIAFSPDGMSGFTEPYFDDRLRDPRCFGSLLTLPGKELIACSGCDSETSRENLKIKFSRDGGKSWYTEIPVYDKAGYSDMAYLNGSIYCFFERDNLTALSVKRFALQDFI
ncbi:MAG: sialidase family protein [Eubacteriales bacterium]|nr:sialidase family protein [Eubacteriales bacterium]